MHETHLSEQKVFPCITFEKPSGVPSIQYHHGCESNQRQQHHKDLQLGHGVHFILKKELEIWFGFTNACFILFSDSESVLVQEMML